MFLDASAILAILLGEEEAPVFIEKWKKLKKIARQQLRFGRL
ncbi:hypothetical protein [Bartonella ancashensis]